MTASNYPRCLQLVLLHEGGYVNHPKDPGGATNKGITQAVYDAYRRRGGVMTRGVKMILDGEVSAIYKRNYWDAIKGDNLPSGVDYAAFDLAVNSGVGRATKMLHAIDTAAPRATVIKKLCASRLNFLHRLAIWSTFGRGWGRRVKEVEEAALRMV